MRNHICSDCGPITLHEEMTVAGNIGINIAGFLGILALGIKFTKKWYLQQIQNRILARQKITNELKLLKTRIQPDFLLESLQALYHKISINRKQAAEMLLKFSELLSYILYEYNDDFVDIQRELFIIKEFITLEKIIHGKQLIITHNITGDAKKQYMPSFILLSLIQNSISTLYDNRPKERHCFNVTINTQDNMLHCEIKIQPADATAIRHVYLTIINTFTTRLEAIYKDNYKLELSEKDPDKYIVTLSLLLADNFSTVKVEETSGAKYAHV